MLYDLFFRKLLLLLLALSPTWSAYTQDLPLLESITFTSKHWTVDYLRTVVQGGEGSIRALASSSSPDDCFMANADLDIGISYEPMCVFDKFDITMSVLDCPSADDPTSSCGEVFEPTSFISFGLQAKGDYFTINGKRVAIGDRLDEHPFLVKWERPLLPKYLYDHSPIPDLNLYNYVLMFDRQGGMLKVYTKTFGGWSERKIAYMEYYSKIIYTNLTLGSLSDLSYVELRYWREQFEAIMKSSTSDVGFSPYVNTILRWMDENIRRQNREIIGPYPNPNFTENKRGFASVEAEALAARQKSIDEWNAAEQERLRRIAAQKKAEEDARRLRDQRYERERQRRLRMQGKGKPQQEKQNRIRRSSNPRTPPPDVPL